MATTKAQEFEKKMKVLREEGLFPEELREVGTGTRYLVISYGGTGADALFQIRRTMKRSLPKDQYEEYFRFLAVDTDINTKNETKKIVDETGVEKTVIVDALEPKEFFHLDNTAAKSAIYTDANLFAEWINPQLPGVIKADGKMLDGNGASATRQIGRLLLFSSVNSDGLANHVKKLVGELTFGTADDLCVMIVTGIAGGTGSGIVIDATYLIRDAITGMAGNVGQNAKYFGFVMLPPTGTDPDSPTKVRSGNRNGYAALKEINQFMTLANRSEKYTQQFSGKMVVSEKNLFDTCYLLDGVSMGVAHKDARAFVKNVLAECLLDMVTSMPVETHGGGAAAPAAVDSLFSDVGAHSKVMVMGKTHKTAPRDADYIYCVLGHGNTTIPTRIIKNYVAKQVYDWMMQMFRKCGNVTREDAERFLKGVFMSNASDMVQKQRIDEAIAKHFLYEQGSKYGPYYVINLLAEAAQVAFEKSRNVFSTQRTKDRYNAVGQYFLQQNNQYFSVYTKVMDALGEVLTRDYDLICKGEYYAATGASNTYTFVPIDLSEGDKATTAVKKYLDGLVTPNNNGPVMVKLLKTIQENRNVWSELLSADGRSGSFDASRELRKFWNKAITEIVNANIEDLLIKVYSGDNDARYDPDSPESVAALKKAALVIFGNMFGAAGIALPTAELDTASGLALDDFSGNNMMFVPKHAPHLRAELETLAAVNKMNIKVYESTSDSQISCYTQYASLPAFKFKWVQRAEEDYETNIGSVGLHISETAGGSQWRDFPNLLPRSTWNFVAYKPGYKNGREFVLADRAVTLFNEAKRLGLTSATPLVGSSVLQYSVRNLSEDRIPDAKLFKEYDIRNVSSASVATLADRDAFAAQISEEAMRKAKVLFASVSSWAGTETAQIPHKLADVDDKLFTEHDLTTTATVLTVPDPKPTGWDEEIAADILRKKPELMVSLRGTVAVLQALENLLKQDNMVEEFCKFVVADLFRYNAPLYTWEYSDGRSQKALLNAKVGDKIQENAPYYFMYQEFAKDADNIVKALQPAYNHIAGEYLPLAEKVQAQLAMNAKAQELYKKNNEKLTYDYRNPDPMTMFGSTEFGNMAKLKDYDAMEISKFYKRMNQTLIAVFSVDPYLK